MSQYDYTEKPIEISRRAFLGVLGIAGAVLWTGAYIATDLIQDRTKYIKMRTQGLYADDRKSKIRQSHNNPDVMRMYKDFAGKPLSHLSEELFHTSYVDRTKLV